MGCEEASELETEAALNGDTERAKLESVLASRGVFNRELMISVDVKVLQGGAGKKGWATAWDVAVVVGGGGGGGAVVEDGDVSTGEGSSGRRFDPETPPAKMPRQGEVLTPVVEAGAPGR